MADEREWDDFDARLRRELGRPARVDPSAIGRIMAEVRTSRRSAPGWRGALAWLFQPRPIAVSPFGALATLGAAAAVAVLVARAAPPRGLSDDGPGPESHGPGSAHNVSMPAARPGMQNVQFVFVNPGASTVAVVGDFNDWDLNATPLRPTGAGGMWSVVVPLPAGEHHYSYVVDGKTWVPDATAPQAPAGELGGTNSVLFVGGRT